MLKKFNWNIFFIVIFYIFLKSDVEGRIHSLHLKDDRRNMVTLSTFGYYKGGSIFVNITNMKTLSTNFHGTATNYMGFSFDKSSSQQTSSYVEEAENSRGACVLAMKDGDNLIADAQRAIMRITQLANGSWALRVYEKDLHGLIFSQNPDSAESKSFETNHPNSTRATAVTTPVSRTKVKVNATKENTRKKRETNSNPDEKKFTDLPIVLYGNDNFMNIQFYVLIENDDQEGLYQLFFHNCYTDPKLSELLYPISLTTHIFEKNGDNYLSAGEMPLPVMYSVLAAVFFVSAFYWVQILWSASSNKVFKIHYLMAVFIFTKSVSVTFHAIDFHFIARDGLPETWAIIFYIVYLLKGILLILCLLLVATGWAFIKYVLSDREKKLFMVLIPLQVIASIAYIIMEETEEGNSLYGTWKNIMILVNIVCFAAILIPIVWSIRHLQEASRTDGKAAMNLAKLRLFRQFYVLVVLYLYFTRIIVYLLQITLPYKLEWMYLLIREVGSYIFFVITGYKFRPGCDNPYFQIPDYESDDEEAQALTSNGLKENLSRVNRKQDDSSDADEEDELFSRNRTTKI